MKNKNELCCIYLSKTQNELSYTNREHVIPAGLGGKAKLPLGMVSNEANKSFSPIEQKTLRNTILAHNRNVLGPGKSGSLSVKKVREPKIQILEAERKSSCQFIDTEYAPQRLGFIFRNTVYFIPQILFPIEKDWSIRIPRFIIDNISNNNFFEINKFFLHLHELIRVKDRKFIAINTDMDIQDKFVLIGKYNDKWFIGSNLNAKQLNKFIEILEHHPLPNDIPTLIPSASQYNYSIKMDFDESMPFIYAKTAFNALAFFMGSNFIMDGQFDNVRNSINSLSEISDLFKQEDLPEWLVCWYKNKVKPKEHFIVINTEESFIKAYVSFYGERPGVIELSHNYEGNAFRKGFICNWECREENYGDISY